MDYNKNRRLDMTPHEEFTPSRTHPNRAPPLRTCSVVETLDEAPKERRQQHESI